jgi:hypothetical protein
MVGDVMLKLGLSIVFLIQIVVCGLLSVAFGYTWAALYLVFLVIVGVAMIFAEEKTPRG